jgi:hypothetical protein
MECLVLAVYLGRGAVRDEGAVSTGREQRGGERRTRQRWQCPSRLQTSSAAVSVSAGGARVLQYVSGAGGVGSAATCDERNGEASFG